MAKSLNRNISFEQFLSKIFLYIAVGFAISAISAYILNYFNFIAYTNKCNKEIIGIIIGLPFITGMSYKVCQDMDIQNIYLTLIFFIIYSSSMGMIFSILSLYIYNLMYILLLTIVAFLTMSLYAQNTSTNLLKFEPHNIFAPMMPILIVTILLNFFHGLSLFSITQLILSILLLILLIIADKTKAKYENIFLLILSILMITIFLIYFTVANSPLRIIQSVLSALLLILFIIIYEAQTIKNAYIQNPINNYTPINLALAFYLGLTMLFLSLIGGYDYIIEWIHFIAICYFL